MSSVESALVVGVVLSGAQRSTISYSAWGLNSLARKSFMPASTVRSRSS